MLQKKPQASSNPNRSIQHHIKSEICSNLSPTAEGGGRLLSDSDNHFSNRNNNNEF